MYNRERLNKTILKQESKNHPCNITLSLWKRKTRRRTRRKAYDKATAKLNRIVRLMERPCFSLYLTSRNFVNLTNSPKLRDYPTENWNIVMREIRQAPIGRKILDESWEKVAQVAKTREGTISTFGSRSPFFLGLGEIFGRALYAKLTRSIVWPRVSTWILGYGEKVEFRLMKRGPRQWLEKSFSMDHNLLCRGWIGRWRGSKEVEVENVTWVQSFDKFYLVSGILSFFELKKKKISDVA